MRWGRAHPTDAARRAGAASLHTPSLRRRVTLVVLVLLAVMLSLLGATTQIVLGNRLEAQLEQRLTERADLGVSLGSQLDPSDLAKRLEGNGISVLLLTSDGQAYAAGPPPPKAAGPGAKAAPPALGSTTPVTRSGDTLEVSRSVGSGATLLLTADAGDVQRTLEQVRIALLAGALAVLLVAALVLGPVIGGALRPLHEITTLARSIREGDRGDRLRPDRPGTELGTTAQAFDEMLDSVEGAEQQALAAERRLRDFLSDAAHELRTPLAGLQAAGEHLLRTNPPREEREQTLVTLLRESRRAGRLVDDMLLMARIDSGLPLERQAVDLASVAAAVVEVRRLRSSTTRLEVRPAAAGTVLVDADADRVAQVVGNLVDNAVRAAGPQGHVRLEVGASPGLDLAGGLAVLDVVDDGPGIAAGDRERVFERLVRLDDGRHRPDSGAGLGLPIARGIARAHGGDLVVVDGPGSGVRFRLTLPVHRQG